MLEDLAPKCCEEFGWEYTPVMVDGEPYVVPAETFHHIHYKQPIFDGVEGVALLADYVGVDDGTGIVHNSPGHGVDDYFACLKEGITDICMPVDDDGKFYTGEEFGTGGPFSGMDTDEANPHIIEFLRERGAEVDIAAAQNPIDCVTGDRYDSQQIVPDKMLAETGAEGYDVLIVPGGTVNMDRLRINPALPRARP